MKTFKTYLNEAASSFPLLKPNLFFKRKEKWFTTYALTQYIADLKNGIFQLNHSVIEEIHKKIMLNLVNDPDGNCFRGIKLGNGRQLQKMSDVPNGNKFNQKLNNDFGEVIGPIKILRDKDYMPWIKSVIEIFVPYQSNYPFMDYSITDQEGIMHKISAKTAKGLGNTVKPNDILTTIEDTLKKEEELDSSIGPLHMAFISAKGKYKKEYDLLMKIFALHELKSIPNILETAYLLVKNYGEDENSEYIKAYKSTSSEYLNNLPPYKKNIDGKKVKADYNKFAIENDTYPNVKALMLAADPLIRKYSSAPYPINKALKLLINLAFKDKVYYAKFAVKPNGDTVWEVRGRKSDYSDLYTGNKDRFGSSRYTTIYLDGKGARGNEKVGLRIESINSGVKNEII